MIMVLGYWNGYTTSLRGKQTVTVPVHTYALTHSLTRSHHTVKAITETQQTHDHSHPLYRNWQMRLKNSNKKDHNAMKQHNAYLFCVLQMFPYIFIYFLFILFAFGIFSFLFLSLSFFFVFVYPSS